MFSTFVSRAAVAALVFQGAQAILEVDFSSNDSIRAAASLVAYDMMSYYKGNLSGQTPGILPGPPPAGDYYWWEAGGMWGTMLDYYKWTGDSTYNEVMKAGMLWQVGPAQDYQPPNITASLGNDDQGFWGMTAMLAAENVFEDPPTGQPQWLALAQAVFNTQADPSRHDGTCGGGLRWQIPPWNNGYDYKNAIANGCFFNLGARLARYTGNETYANWAEQTWDWITAIGFMDAEYNIYDGAHVEDNCTDINKQQYSYNNAVYLQGAAFMYAYTNGSAVWESRIKGLLAGTISTFFENGVAVEIACEDVHTCTTDMYSYKAYLHRWLAQVTQLAPFTSATIMPILLSSAKAAVSQCTGGDNQRTCGFAWKTGVFDGRIGAGQQMSVLGALTSLLVGDSKVAVTNSTGGTSAGNYNAGSQSSSYIITTPATTGDKAGAGFLTFLILGSVVGMFGWMSVGM